MEYIRGPNRLPYFLLLLQLQKIEYYVQPFNTNCLVKLQPIIMAKKEVKFYD